MCSSDLWIVVAEWDDDAEHIIDVQCAKVDGDTVKADTYYTLKNGAFKEVLE